MRYKCSYIDRMKSKKGGPQLQSKIKALELNPDSIGGWGGNTPCDLKFSEKAPVFAQ